MRTTPKEIMEDEIQTLTAEVLRLNEEIVTLTDANDHNVKAAQQWQREAEKAKEKAQYYKDNAGFMSFCLNGYKAECERLQKEIKARHERDYDGRKELDKLRADVATLENKAHHQGWAEGYAEACHFHGLPDDCGVEIFSLEDRRAMQARISTLECELADLRDW
jgi:chromosome segregation ATPase